MTPRVALDQRHVGDVEPADLVDAGHHLEQPVLHVQPRLPPQARVDGGGRLLLRQEAVGLETPDHAALRVGDPRMFDRAHEAARGVVEIGGVGKRQRLEHRRLLRDDGGGGVLGRFLGSFAGGCCGHGVVLPRVSRNSNSCIFSSAASLLPRPALRGERVGVRGSLDKRDSRRLPLTRALRSPMLSPPCGAR